MLQTKTKEVHVRVSRRDEYAEETRRAIIAAARELFSKHGCFQTTVEDIAKLARVAAVTVYSSVGGKAGLMRILTDIWTTSQSIEACREMVADLNDPAAILAVIANTARKMREEFGDIVILMLVTAPHDKLVAENLAVATERYRQAFAKTAHRLKSLDGLREGISEADAVDVLWFYFGFWGLYTLRNDNGWDYDKAERWLCDAATLALLKPAKPA